MTKFLLKKLLILTLLFTLPLGLSQCTSSDDEIVTLDSEFDEMDLDDDGGELIDDIDDLEEFASDDMADDFESDDGFENDDFEDEEDSFGEVADFDDDDFEDNDEFDDELDDDFGDDDELAESDEFDEFDEFDEDDQGGEFAQSEESLQQELQQEDYPVAENAQPAFPEEVMGQSGPAASSLPGDGTITSESQDIIAVNPNLSDLPQDDLGAADPIIPMDGDEGDSTQTWVPVVKIKTDPFFRNQRLMNAVYIARPRDGLSDISQKIYGADRSDQLRADNPHLAKGIDPGDKVYYNSPNRPADKTILKFYYDDIGLPPQMYRTESGDNMRRLGSKLLGFPDGWKELWAINPSVDSKTILPSDLDLKYWTGNESAATIELVETQTIPQASDTSSTGGMGGTVEEFAEAELPPEPPLPEAEIAMPENNLEPEIVADIEPFPEQGIEQVPTPTVMAAKNNESLLSVGAMALLLIAGVGLVAIQIKKRKDNTAVRPQSLEYTQV